MSSETLWKSTVSKHGFIMRTHFRRPDTKGGDVSVSDEFFRNHRHCVLWAKCVRDHPDWNQQKKFKSQHLLWLCWLPSTYSTLGQKKKSCRLIFPSHYYLQLLMTPPRGSPLKSNSMSMYFPCGSECDSLN